MKVLISWSGESSARIARVLRDWLATVLPTIDLWMSSEDIRKGCRWSHDLARQLSETHFGLLIVLPENQANAWLNFEAGAISKWVDFANVAPVLFNMDPSELKGPLAQFQATAFSQREFGSLLQSIVAAGGGHTDQAHFNSILDFSWESLRQRIEAILAESAPLPGTASASRGHSEPIISPTAEQAAILTHIGRSEGNFMTEDDVAKSVQMNRAKAQLLLADLVQADYLSAERIAMLGMCYRVIGRGSKYLIQEGLI